MSSIQTNSRTNIVNITNIHDHQSVSFVRVSLKFMNEQNFVCNQLLQIYSFVIIAA